MKAEQGEVVLIVIGGRDHRACETSTTVHPIEVNLNEMLLRARPKAIIFECAHTSIDRT